MTLRDRLSSANLKATHQRMTILAAMDDCKAHPSPERIYEIIKPGNPTISLATVYNTLESFTQFGLVHKVASISGNMRYDSNMGAHGHIYCHNTDEIIDYYDEELNGVIIDFFKKKKISNLKIKNITLNINGDKLDKEKEVLIK
ncbi:MAG: transcriptional repressor [Bacteroidetes bacterium]|nr:MAG: transcriptional repressor [Bacteroidota bacterium]